MATRLEHLMTAAKTCSPAVWALVICSILALPGFANAMLQNRTSEWRMRLIHGQPLVVRFVCGTNSGLDCRDSYTISYSREALRFCEHISKNGQSSDAASRCNSDPARGWLTVDGILYSYDRLGVVRLDSKFVGQLMLP
jgi:hypothetical protein